MQYSIGVEDSNPIVWIIGNTVLMDGVEACLREMKMDNLVRWNLISPEFEKDLKAYHPKLIIFERDTPGVRSLLSMLAENPGTHLLGIDLEFNQVLVMNSFRIETRSMSDLHRIVQEVAGSGSNS
jgi:hypothetical protein